ncbi:MAG: hypothetical protein UU12_C0045G0005 [Candidatus Woesebacteria bacterium GW2011_GWA2_40_7b]|uniref:Beta-lactamase n=1 Tax=Candidatus Woesebacteria bacterium GW2011_GWA2_40_7b TaxID=1618563 RepID=A0A0G0T3X7_9BACT|nr:MAG: hypothetical protein UU12_C0045G0005 [Candidatus Woesebacteria bacterium GW2011_GWA2_40_7b]
MTGEFSRRNFIKLTGTGMVALAGLPLGFPKFPETDYSVFDVLNSRTKCALAEKARSLISPSPEAADALAKKLGGRSASTDRISGPLAVEQLMGITTFSFDAFGISTSALDFDFNSADLVPGDFLYFIGKDLNSDYMMTISRRDSLGTLWAVTNTPDKSGRYVITEVPAWDPKNPEASFIKQLASGNNSVGFVTGQNGVDIFRLKPREKSALDMIDHSEVPQKLQEKINLTVKSAKGEWRVMVSNMDSGKIVAENNSRELRYSASLTKVPLAMSTLAYLEYKAGSPEALQKVLKTTYLEERTFDSLFRSMLSNASDEDAARTLIRYLEKEKVDIQALIASQGIANTNIETRLSTEEDIWKLFKNLHDRNNKGMLKYPGSHDYLLECMSKYDPSAKVWLVAVAVADSGIVEVEDRSYFISLNGQPKKGVELDFFNLGAELVTFVDLFAGYMSEDKNSSGAARVF